MAQGTVWWNELRTSDEKGAIEFYTKLLGWGTFQLSASESGETAGAGAYTVWMTGWTQAGGMMRANGVAPGGAGWLPFISVDDVDECAQKASALGGVILEGPFDIPNSGRFAVLKDPQGAVFGIAKPLASE